MGSYISKNEYDNVEIRAKEWVDGKVDLWIDFSKKGIKLWYFGIELRNFDEAFDFAQQVRDAVRDAYVNSKRKESDKTNSLTSIGDISQLRDKVQRAKEPVG